MRRRWTGVSNPPDARGGSGTPRSVGAFRRPADTRTDFGRNAAWTTETGGSSASSARIPLPLPIPSLVLHVPSSESARQLDASPWRPLDSWVVSHRARHVYEAALGQR